MAAYVFFCCCLFIWHILTCRTASKRWMLQEGVTHPEGTYKSTNNTVRKKAIKHVVRVIQQRSDFIAHVLRDYMWIQSFATAGLRFCTSNCDCHEAHEAHFLLHIHSAILLNSHLGSEIEVVWWCVSSHSSNSPVKSKRRTDSSADNWGSCKGYFMERVQG